MALPGIIVPLDRANNCRNLPMQVKGLSPCPVSQQLGSVKKGNPCCRVPGVSAKAHMEAKPQFTFFFNSLSFYLIGAKSTSPAGWDPCT